MTRTRFSNLIVSLHWLTVFLVLAIFILPYAKDLLSGALGGTGNLFTLHKSLGILVLVVTLIRLAARVKQGAPDLLPADATFQRIGSTAVHGLLYFLLLAMPLSGLLFSSRPVSLFWLVDIGPLDISTRIRDAALQFHRIAQYLMALLILGHAFMALWHHYVLHDGVLKAMMPRKN